MLLKIPLSVRVVVNVQGSATITNYFSNLTIWTGDPFSGVGNSGKTFVRNPKVPQPAITATPPDRPTACKESDDYICLTDKSIRGPDIIDNDLTLKNMSDEEMFEQFFGLDFPPTGMISPPVFTR